MRSQKVSRLILSAGILSFMLCGCQNASVDYDLDTQGIQETTTQENSPLEQESGAKWEEEFMVLGDHEEKNVTINTYIVVPDVEEMSVVELQKLSIDEAYKKKLIELLYGHLEVYSREDEDRPKEYWLKTIERMEFSIEWAEERISTAEENNFYSDHTDEDFLESCREELAKAKEYLKNAPEEASIVTDYTGDIYEGQYLSCNYILEIENNSIYFRTLNNEKMLAPKDMKAQEIYHSSTDYDNNQSENKCSLTVEEAQKQAEDLLRSIGWTEPVWQEPKVVKWQGHDIDEYSIDGYSFEYYQGAAGLAYGKFDGGYEQSFSNGLADYVRKAVIDINDDGILSVQIDVPVNFIQVTKDVDLLSIDTIKGIVKKELNENPDPYFNGKNEVSFLRMELNYIPVKDESREGYYSYVPAWRISTSMNGKKSLISEDVPVIVNAMDGSIIYLEELMELDGGRWDKDQVEE